MATQRGKFWVLANVAYQVKDFGVAWRGLLGCLLACDNDLSQEGLDKAATNKTCCFMVILNDSSILSVFANCHTTRDADQRSACARFKISRIAAISPRAGEIG